MLKRSICILLATTAAIATVGCAGGDPKTNVGPEPKPAINREPVAPTQINPPALPSTDSRSSAAPAQQKPAAQATAMPTIPSGAKFSIFCESFSTPDHVTYATNLKNLLARNSKLKDWYVIHQANQSSLYHGYYAEFDPTAAGSDKTLKREAERAQRDHQLIESIPNPQAPDRKLFPRSLFVPLDSPDPDAPPAWNLTNAPGYWTVQVAAFTGADRKRQTVEAVRAARAENIPAFYYHGPAVSSVCVGSWDRSAVKVPEFMAAPGDQNLDKGATDEKDVVLNVSGQTLDQSAAEQKGSDGKSMRMLQSTAEVVDSTLKETLKQYPAQAVDGFEVPLKGVDKDGHPVMRTRPAMIVMIPRGQNNVDTASRNGAQTNEPDPTLIRPGSGSNNLGARLRGLGQ